MRFALAALVLVLVTLSDTPAKACGMYVPSRVQEDTSSQLLAKAWRAEKRNQIELASSLYRKASRHHRVSDSKRLRAYLGASRTLAASGDTASSTLYAQRAVALSPHSARANYTLAVRLTEGDPASAVKHFETALEGRLPKRLASNARTQLAKLRAPAVPTQTVVASAR